MPTISNTPRPGYVYDSTDDVWYPIGTGTHNHSEIAKTLIDAKGDLIVGTAADTVSRLAVGATNGQVLTVDSAEATGLKYATPAASIPANAFAEVLTSETTTSLTFTDLTTAGPAVTLTTGTKALVIITAVLQSYNSDGMRMSYDVSGATTIAASEDFGIASYQTATSTAPTLSRASVQTLTAGSNTFTAKYKSEAGAARYAVKRMIFVMNLA